MTTSLATPSSPVTRTRRGRPPGSRTAIPNTIRYPVHLTINPLRHPYLTEWLSAREPGSLATDVAELMERALAGQSVAVLADGGGQQTQVYEVDMSGLLEWE